MRKPAALVLAALLAVGGLACATNPAPKDVQVIQAADNIASVLDTFAQSVIGASDTKLITIRQAVQILTVIRAAYDTLEKTPEGGYAIVSSALDQVERTVSPSVRSRIKPYLVAARATLEALRGN